jgi:ribosome biogenesis GTPase A
MSQVNIVRRCYNCGAILQTKEKEKEGYIAPRVLETAPLDAILFCEHCFHENRFNLMPQEASVNKDFLTMLEDAKASDAFIVYLVDLFSFECSFISKISECIRSLPMIVIANKRDLMPEEAVDADLKEYVAHRFRVAGLHLSADEVYLMSLSSLSDTKEIAKIIDEKRRRHDVYIIGATGAGKTLFLSSFLRDYENKSSRTILTSEYPGTHLRVMQIPLDSSSSIYDTPGTSLDNSLLGKGGASLSSSVMPHAAVKGRRYVLEKGSSLFIGGLARLDLVETPDKRVPIVVYLSEDVQIKKVSKRKDMEEFFHKSLEKKALAPSASFVKEMLDLDVFDFPVKETGPRDIGVAGLGWMSFFGKSQTFRLYVPKGIGVYASRAKIKGKE